MAANDPSMFSLSSKVPVIQALDFSLQAPGSFRRYWLRVAENGLGQPIFVPLMVARGIEPGPVLGITAAIHGNELNGIPVIQRIFRDCPPEKLKGILVGIPVVNVPGFLLGQRVFNNGVDLNHIMPGKAQGNSSEVYAFRIVDRVIRHFDYLLDLHTASFGRVNAYYIRADMAEPITAELAMLQHAHIVVDNPPHDGTLRGAADEMGIPAITLEVGDPFTFQKGMIRSSLTGVFNTLVYLNMVDGEVEPAHRSPVRCKRSYWIYTDQGGILEVLPQVTELVQAGQRIALVRNVFGDLLTEYFAPDDGIVIGKSVNPVNQTGDRILHLGILE